MILVDTSIWVAMFRRGRFKAELATLIGNDQVCIHPFVVAELACGYLPDRQQTLLELDKLTALPTIRTADVRYMLETRGLFSKGVPFNAKARRSKISWTICPIPIRPFDYIVKAGQPARPKTVTG
jgi:predicted nucleic acid-binding protein